MQACCVGVDVTNSISFKSVAKTCLDRVHSAQQVLVLSLKVLLALVGLFEFLSEVPDLFFMARLVLRRRLGVVLALYGLEALPQRRYLLSQRISLFGYRIEARARI